MEEGRREQDARGVVVVGLGREVDRDIEGGGADACEDRNAAAFDGEAQQPGALFGGESGVLTGGGEEDDAIDGGLGKIVEEFERGAEIDFTVFAARGDYCG